MVTAAGLRLDPGPLATDWGMPRRTRIPRWAMVAVPTACLVFLASLVWALGGFSPRRSPSVPTSPGTTVDLGPLTFTGSAAYAKADTQHWTVSFPGICENTTDERLFETQLTNIAFISAEPVSRAIADSTSVTMQGSAAFNPGPSACTIAATYPLDTRWTGHVLLLLNPLESYDAGVTGNSGTAWRPQGSPAVILMPLEIVT